jgi:hydrogenase maturation protease
VNKQPRFRASARRLAVAGIGNTIVGDDGIGIHIVRALRDRIDDARVEIFEEEGRLFDLVERVIGFGDIVLVDAAMTGTSPVGTCTVHEIRAEADGVRNWSMHTGGLPVLFRVAGYLGYPIPPRLALVAVEVEDAQTFRDRCTPSAAAALPAAVERCIDIIRSRLAETRFTHSRKENTV